MDLSKGIEVMKSEVNQLFGLIEYGYLQAKRLMPEYQSSFSKDALFREKVTFQYNGYSLIAQHNLITHPASRKFLTLGLYNQLVDERGFITGKDNLSCSVIARRHRLDYSKYELFFDEEDDPLWLDEEDVNEGWTTSDLGGIWISKLLTR